MTDGSIFFEYIFENKSALLYLFVLFLLKGHCPWPTRKSLIYVLSLESLVYKERDKAGKMAP